MKKSTLVVLSILLLFTSVSFAADQTIVVQTTTLTVPASGTSYSQPMDLTGKHGYFSVQSVITGGGTLTISYQMSNSKNEPQVWSTPVGASDIATGLTAGTYLYKFEPITIARWLRLVFTETGGANSVTLTSNMAGQ